MHLTTINDTAAAAHRPTEMVGGMNHSLYFIHSFISPAGQARQRFLGGLRRGGLRGRRPRLPLAADQQAAAAAIRSGITTTSAAVVVVVPAATGGPAAAVRKQHTPDAPLALCGYDGGLQE